MPVAIWNGGDAEHWYDVDAVFTGSATIVDGKPVIVYPGVCDEYPPTGNVSGCKHGYSFAVAHPADASDPLYTNWTKASYNPIVPDTFDDPSTAWKTEHGEWRMLGHCGDDAGAGFCAETGGNAPEFASTDFRSWKMVGGTNLPAGECVSMYPLPPLTPGTEAPKGAKLPTHVHKHGCGWPNDCTHVGTWVDGKPGEPGKWVSTVRDGYVDAGDMYASKDFWDPIKERRINWGWALGDPLESRSAQTLPRVVTYHPELRQLTWSPVPEQDQLREATLARVDAASLADGEALGLGAGQQAEVEVEFELPDHAATFGVAVMAKDAATSGSVFYIQYTPPSGDGAYSVTVGVEQASGDVKKPLGAQVGVEAPTPGYRVDQLQLLPGERTVKLRVYVDHWFSEAYWQGGRVAMTVIAPPSSQAALAARAIQGEVRVRAATSWRVGSIWVSPEEVLATPRMEAKAPTAAMV